MKTAVLVGTLAMACLATGVAYAQSASPAASPNPSPTPIPVLQFGGALTGGTFDSVQTNATGALDTASGADRPSRTDVTNALVNATVNLGAFHVAATGGAYDFPTVGYAINSVAQSGANTMLYSALPLYDVEYVANAHLSFYAGKLGTQLGQEDAFTYQNADIQRGYGWAIEPVVSHGVRGAYANGAWTLQLEENDGYYGGAGSRAFEGSIACAATSTQTISLAVIFPKADAPPNPTAPVANKAEEDLMYSGTFGKLIVTPYLLWVQSPRVPSLRYGSEGAFDATLLGVYDLSERYSLGFRVESISNTSSSGDASANADLIGYGPGSAAADVTLTPTYRFGATLLRFEWSHARITGLVPPLGFGPNGTGTSQNRYALEVGTTR